MIKTFFPLLIFVGAVQAATLDVDLKCNDGISYNDSSKVLSCGNLKVTFECNPTVYLRELRVTCQSPGNINFYCPGGMKQISSERGAPIKYECADKSTLDKPLNLRIIVTN